MQSVIMIFVHVCQCCIYLPWRYIIYHSIHHIIMPMLHIKSHSCTVCHAVHMSYMLTSYFQCNIITLLITYRNNASIRTCFVRQTLNYLCLNYHLTKITIFIHHKGFIIRFEVEKNWAKWGICLICSHAMLHFSGNIFWVFRHAKNNWSRMSVSIWNKDWRKSDRINDRSALAVIGHEDQGSRGYSAF